MRRKLFAIIVGIIVVLFSLYPVKFLTDFISWAINGFKGPTGWMMMAPNYVTSFLGAFTVGWLIRKQGWLYAYPLVLIWLPGVLAQIIYIRFAEVEFQQKIYFFSHYFLNIILLPIGGLIGERLYRRLHYSLGKN